MISSLCLVSEMEGKSLEYYRVCLQRTLLNEKGKYEVENSKLNVIKLYLNID